MAKILLAEDDIDAADQISLWLRSERHIVDAAYDGKTALELLQSYPFDLLILDWQLPELSGLDVAKAYKKQGGTARILILTGKAKIENKVEGFDAGADDYLTKPFHPQELSLRVKALLKRPSAATSPILSAHSLTLEPDKFKVTCQGKTLELSQKEFMLLEFFMKHPDQPFSQDALLNRVWPSDSEVSHEAVRTCVKNLRRKLETAGEPDLIKTVHGVGYKLELQSTEQISN